MLRRPSTLLTGRIKRRSILCCFGVVCAVLLLTPAVATARSTTAQQIKQLQKAVAALQKLTAKQTLQIEALAEQVAAKHAFLSGVGAPAVGLGTLGDFYIDSSTYLIYGPKTFADWGVPTSLKGGPKGDAGPAGPQGSIGPVGPQGAKGAKGDTGPAGPQGPAGPDGPQGLKGAKGDAGPAGPQGATGPDGPQGVKGAKGDIGPVGPVGPQGATGLAGPKGDVGPAGPGGTGPAGPTGPQGEPGPAGANGPQPFFQSTTIPLNGAGAIVATIPNLGDVRASATGPNWGPYLTSLQLTNTGSAPVTLWGSYFDHRPTLVSPGGSGSASLEYHYGIPSITTAVDQITFGYGAHIAILDVSVRQNYADSSTAIVDVQGIVQ